MTLYAHSAYGITATIAIAIIKREYNRLGTGRNLSHEVFNSLYPNNGHYPTIAPTITPAIETMDPPDGPDGPDESIIAPCQHHHNHEPEPTIGDVQPDASEDPISFDTQGLNPFPHRLSDYLKRDGLTLQNKIDECLYYFDKMGDLKTPKFEDIELTRIRRVDNIASQLGHDIHSVKIELARTRNGQDMHATIEPDNSYTEKQLLTWLNKAIERDEKRPILQYGYQGLMGKHLAYSAADGYRVHMTWQKLDVKAWDNGTFPLKNSPQYDCEGRYPDLSAVIPSTFTTHITVHADELTNAIKKAMVFARDNANSVQLQCHPLEMDRLIVLARSPEYGDIEIQVNGSITSIEKPINMAFNGKYLLDGLSLFKGLVDLKMRPDNAMLMGTYGVHMALIMPMSVTRTSTFNPSPGHIHPIGGDCPSWAKPKNSSLRSKPAPKPIDPDDKERVQQLDKAPGKRTKIELLPVPVLDDRDKYGFYLNKDYVRFHFDPV